MTTDFINIGKGLPRVDGIAKATGSAKYAADLSLPGMLWGKILRSPHPHARIIAIDTQHATALPGVWAVVTGKDTIGFKAGGIATKGDEPYLAIDKVRFIGDEVAAVAAVDEETAEEALDLIKVTYEVLPPVLDPLTAMSEASPLVHDDMPRNISAEMNMNIGDVDKAFSECRYIREDEFETDPIRHGFIEPHAALASWDPSGKLTFQGSKQSPYFTYRNMAKSLGLKSSQIRIVQPVIGGGFGGKNEMFSLDFCAGFLSMITRRPVKIVASQTEVLYAYRQRHPARIKLKTGFLKDGTLHAMEADIVAEGGAYKSIGALSLYLMVTFLCLPYRIPNVRAKGHRVYTNTQTSCAMRGHGVPQVRFAAEMQMEMAAEAMGVDSIDLRLKNAVQEGETTSNGFKIGTCGLTESIIGARKIVEKWRKEVTPSADPHIKRGIGVASYGYLTAPRIGGHNSCAALVKVHEDGCVAVVSGSTDVGQGSDTVLSMIAAEVLGVRLEDIRYGVIDSDMMPLDPGVFGSRVTFMAGNAVKLAAEDARRQLAETAASELNAPVDDIVFRDRQVTVKGAPEKSMPFDKVVKISQYGGIGKTILGRGYWAPEGMEAPQFKTGLGNTAGAYSFGTQIAEVAVDIQTGRVKVLRFATVHDCGRPLNQMLVEGQLEGSMIGGIGHTFTEEIVRKDGQTMNPSFLEYRMPTTLDACDVHIENVDTNEPEGPYGAKESGEGTQIPVMPVLATAVHDAIGIWFKKATITPEIIVTALKKASRHKGETL